MKAIDKLRFISCQEKPSKSAQSVKNRLSEASGWARWGKFRGDVQFPGRRLLGRCSGEDADLEEWLTDDPFVCSAQRSRLDLGNFGYFAACDGARTISGIEFGEGLGEMAQGSADTPIRLTQSGWQRLAARTAVVGSASKSAFRENYS